MATSQVQKHFLINSVYKRSKRYFDIPKLNSLEKQLELQRRMPQTTKQTIESMVDQSFVCSEQLLSNKVNHDIDFFYGKVHQEENDDNQTVYTARTKLSKAIDMDKMLARSHFEHEKPKYRNQQQFNNFSISEHRPRKSLDFATFIDRSKSNLKAQRYGNPENDLAADQKVGKTYQRNIYDRSKLACYVAYKKNGKSKQKQEIDSTPVYNLQKIRRGQSMTKRGRPILYQFYHGNGKKDPSQLDNRILKENQYFWRGARQERQRLADYSVNKKKEDEVMGRLSKILNRKKIPDQRGEMCDQKYFRRQTNL